MQNWIVVGSADNFELLRGRGFDLAVFKASRTKQAGEMRPGDRVVFYLTKVVQFGGIVEVTSQAFEDGTDIGLHSDSKEGERFPNRVHTKPLVIAEPGDYVDVRAITDLLEKTRRHGPRSSAWPSAATSTRSRRTTTTRSRACCAPTSRRVTPRWYRASARRGGGGCLSGASAAIHCGVGLTGPLVERPSVVRGRS